MIDGTIAVQAVHILSIMSFFDKRGKTHVSF